jgi:hypothetical protein
MYLCAIGQRARLLPMDMFRDMRSAVRVERFERFQRRTERFGHTG